MPDIESTATTKRPVSPAKQFIVDDYTSKARAAFLELETIITSHRASNVIPTLAASDIHDAATDLLSAVLALKRNDALDPVPEIRPRNPNDCIHRFESGVMCGGKRGDVIHQERGHSVGYHPFVADEEESAF